MSKNSSSSRPWSVGDAAIAILPAIFDLAVRAGGPTVESLCIKPAAGPAARTNGSVAS